MVETHAMNMLTFPDRASASSACATHISNLLSGHVDDTGSATLLVSGGSTPGDVFANLSETDVSWSKITVGLVDERWVDSTSDASNEKLVRDKLLQNKAAAAAFLPMKTGHDTAHSAAAEINSAYSQTFESASVVMLGMGPDSHTASWFPGTNDLPGLFDNTTDYIAAIDATDAPVAGDMPERMTITPLAISKAESAVLLIFGDDKRQVLENALNKTELEVPIKGAIDRLGDKLTVFWAA